VFSVWTVTSSSRSWRNPLDVVVLSMLLPASSKIFAMPS